jgi:flagellar motor protein MotB
MSRQIKFEAPHQPIVPHWFVTFSDMRVVLLCFFVLLVGFSSTDKEKCSRGPGNLSGHPGSAAALKTDNDSLLSRYPMSGGTVQMTGYEWASEYEALAYYYKGLDVRVRASVVSNVLDYRLTRRGFEIAIQCGAVFREGEATFAPGATAVLDVIADATRGLPHPMQVRAAGDPFFTPDEATPTSEALAFRRATVVCRYLSDKGHIPMDQWAIGSAVASADAAASSAPGRITITVLPQTRKRTS